MVMERLCLEAEPASNTAAVLQEIRKDFLTRDC
jgi:hypothetical protein